MDTNNCASCDHKRYPDGGHCYMFRFAPTTPCAKHTVQPLAVSASVQQVLLRMARNAVDKFERVRK